MSSAVQGLTYEALREEIVAALHDGKLLYLVRGRKMVEVRDFEDAKNGSKAKVRVHNIADYDEESSFLLTEYELKFWERVGG